MNPEEQQNYKKALLFKIGIVFIVAAIFFLWLANLQNVFKTQESLPNNTLDKVKQDINDSLKEAEDSFNKAASSTDAVFVKELLEKASSTATSTVSTTTASIEIKKELTNIITTATSATTTITKTSCPEYINCMPTIGESRPCVIPAGCEKITQIAY